MCADMLGFCLAFISAVYQVGCWLLLWPLRSVVKNSLNTLWLVWQHISIFHVAQGKKKNQHKQNHP